MQIPVRIPADANRRKASKRAFGSEVCGSNSRCNCSLKLVRAIAIESLFLDAIVRNREISFCTRADLVVIDTARPRCRANSSSLFRSARTEPLLPDTGLPRPNQTACQWPVHSVAGDKTSSPIHNHCPIPLAAQRWKPDNRDSEGRNSLYHLQSHMKPNRTKQVGSYIHLLFTYYNIEILVRQETLLPAGHPAPEASQKTGDYVSGTRLMLYLSA